MDKKNSEEPTNRENCELECSYPHIMDSILLFWGNIEFLQWCDSLLVQDRNEDRRGFTFKAFDEIDFLRNVHRIAFPLFEKKKCPWSNANLRQ